MHLNTSYWGWVDATTLKVNSMSGLLHIFDLLSVTFGFCQAFVGSLLNIFSQIPRHVRFDMLLLEDGL